MPPSQSSNSSVLGDPRVAPKSYQRLLELLLGLITPSTLQQDNPPKSASGAGNKNSGLQTVTSGGTRAIIAEVGDRNENAGNIVYNPVEQSGLKSKLYLIMSTFVKNDNKNCGSIESDGTVPKAGTNTESGNAQGSRSFLSPLYLIISTVVGSGNKDSCNIKDGSVSDAAPGKAQRRPTAL